MNRVFVRLYAELNDALAPERRQRRFELPFEPGETLRQLLATLGVKPEDVDVALAEGVAVGLDHPLRDGEKISLYPVFEAFDVTSLARLRAGALRRPRFRIEPRLRPLAELLRASGFDVELGEGEGAESDGPGGRIRIVDTPGTGLGATHLLVVSRGPPEAQLLEVVERLQLETRSEPRAAERPDD